jgi:peptide chain release factor 1
MLASFRQKLAQLEQRLGDVNNLLSQSDINSDRNQFRTLSKEHAEIEPIVQLWREFLLAEADETTAKEMMLDPSLREFADEEIHAARDRQLAVEQALQMALLPKDPNDERNVFLEIRAGTGGDESALFAGDLLRMYTRYAERQRWQVEMVSASESDLGGFREVIVRLIGQGAYSKLKFESGGHRVQRVPATETQGRIHTSACTVAILPEADPIKDIVINPSELRIDTFRA